MNEEKAKATCWNCVNCRKVFTTTVDIKAQGFCISPESIVNLGTIENNEVFEHTKFNHCPMYVKSGTVVEIAESIVSSWLKIVSEHEQQTSI